MLSTRPKIAEAPGLELVKKADGTFYPLWRANREAVAEGYLPKSIRINFDPHDPAMHKPIRQACQQAQAAMEEWFATRGHKRVKVRTILDLSRLYQTHEASPFHGVKFNTRKGYLQELRDIEASFGTRFLEKITASDFKRWHTAAGAMPECG